MIKSLSMNIFKQKKLILLVALLGIVSLTFAQNVTTSSIFQGQQYEDFVQSVLLPASVSDAPNNGQAYWQETGETTGSVGFGTLIYEPNTGFVGNDTITITFYRPPFTKTEKTIIIEVKASVVVAVDDQVQTISNQGIVVDVLTNDTKTNGTLTVREILAANNAKRTGINPDGTLTFVPADDFDGITYLSYLVCNEIDVCDYATVIVNVENDNTPTSDTLNIFTTQHKSIPIATNLDGFTLQEAPAKGWIDDSSDVVEYIPNGDQLGTEVLIYQSELGNATKLINIEILNGQVVNVYAKDDYAYTPVNEAVEIAFLENDAQAANFQSVQIISQTRYGTLTEGASGFVTYQPNPNFTTLYEYTVDRFTYMVTHADGTTETATVYIYVNDFYPSASTFELTVTKNSPLAIQYAIPIQYNRFEVVSQGSAGKVEFFQSIDTEVYGQQVVGEKVLLYTPNPEVTGYDEFEVEYCVDSGTEKCRSVKIKVNILDVELSAEEKCVLDGCVWEGDINDDGIVNMQDVLSLGYAVGQTGSTRATSDNDYWYGKASMDWDQSTDLKHADANGDGVVSAKDTAAISQYYGNKHKITPTAMPGTDPLPIFYGKPDTIPVVGPGSIIEFPIILGNEYYPVEDIYGLTFNINYSPSTFVEGSGTIEFEDSWFTYGSPILSLEKEVFTGRIETAGTRTNGATASGYGRVGSTKLVSVEDLDVWKLGKEVVTSSISISASAINSAGQVVDLGTEEFTFKIDPTMKVEQPIEEVADEELALTVYPNPATEVIGLNLASDQVASVEVFNMTGKKVFEAQNINQIQVKNWKVGLYIVKAYTTTGDLVSSKFEVIE